MKNPFKNMAEVYSYASSHYLSMTASAKLFEGDDDELVEFVSENLWQPFENYGAEEVLVMIINHADSLVSTFNLKFKES